MAETIVQDGYARQIVTARRGDAVRLSPHIFTPMRHLRKVSQWLQGAYLQYGHLTTRPEDRRNHT